MQLEGSSRNVLPIISDVSSSTEPFLKINTNYLNYITGINASNTSIGICSSLIVVSFSSYCRAGQEMEECLNPPRHWKRHYRNIQLPSGTPRANDIKAGPAQAFGAGSAALTPMLARLIFRKKAAFLCVEPTMDYFYVRG